VFTAVSGLGKTTVLRRACAETRGPRRRFVTVSCPPEEDLLFIQLAERLGKRVDRGLGRLGAWRELERAVRVSSLEGFQVVLAVESCDRPYRPLTRRALGWVEQLGTSCGNDLTIIEVERAAAFNRSASGRACGIDIRLEPLTRSEAERFLRTKLGAAGCTEPIFTPRAVTRLHGLSAGIPRVLERLALLSLIGGATWGLEVIPPEVVDATALECPELAPRLAGWA
jgi:hypothetical protein